MHTEAQKRENTDGNYPYYMGLSSVFICYQHCAADVIDRFESGVSPVCPNIGLRPQNSNETLAKYLFKA